MVEQDVRGGCRQRGSEDRHSIRLGGSLNEEANPRIEDLFLIGERPIGSTGKYTVGYFNRIAGAEETIQATEVLTALEIGASKRPTVIVNVETEDGSQLGFIERVGPGQWRFTWKSAYSDC